MQAVAAEMNLSETAFLHRERDGFRLRWFTPRVEVDLCGHATLASAHVLWTEGHLAATETQLVSHQERPALGRAATATGSRWTFQPSPSSPPPNRRHELAEALGVPIVSAGRNAFDWLVEVDDEETVQVPESRLAPTGPVAGARRDRDQPR